MASRRPASEATDIATEQVQDLSNVWLEANTRLLEDWFTWQGRVWQSWIDMQSEWWRQWQSQMTQVPTWMTGMRGAEQLA